MSATLANEAEKNCLQAYKRSTKKETKTKNLNESVNEDNQIKAGANVCVSRIRALYFGEVITSLHSIVCVGPQHTILAFFSFLAQSQMFFPS